MEGMVSSFELPPADCRTVNGKSGFSSMAQENRDRVSCIKSISFIDESIWIFPIRPFLDKNSRVLLLLSILMFLPSLEVAFGKQIIPRSSVVIFTAAPFLVFPLFSFLLTKAEGRTFDALLEWPKNKIIVAIQSIK